MTRREVTTMVFSSTQHAEDVKALRADIDMLITKLVAKSVDKAETGWVIELGESEPSHPSYWMGPAERPAEWPFGMWSDKHLKAVRFSRKEDAEAVVKIITLLAGDDSRAQFRIAEHCWG